MNRAKTIIPAAAVLIIFVLSGCRAEQPKTLGKNYGYSHGVVSIGPDGAQALSIDEIVPPKAELSANLEKAGFTITENDAAPGSVIPAERVLAKKDDKFFDICYGLTVEQAKELFANYETAYEDYYLLAQNEAYVYAVSDEQTFKTAGFKTLETNGILFVWE